ncbi:45835_t:CDS:2, partial [Gigaspora margarita]
EKLQSYVKNSVPANTQKSTDAWAKRFKEYVNHTHPEVNLETLQDKVTAASLLSEFIVQARIQNNTEYASDSLYVGVCAINRYFQTTFKHEPINIHNDFEFKKFREILDGRMKELEESSTYKGADPLTEEEMTFIFDHPQLSRGNPKDLLYRQGGAYHKLKLKDFTLREDGGYGLFTVHDKTHQGGYFNHRRAHEKAQDQSHIIPPHEPNEIGPIAEMNLLYQNGQLMQMRNFFFLSGFMKEICTLTGIDCVDVQAGMSITKHRTIEAYNMYRSQNEQQRVTIAKLVVLPGTKDKTDENNNKVNDEFKENNNEVNDEFKENKDNGNNYDEPLLTRSRLPFTPLSTNEDI